jgi:hypothetical protein
LNFLKGGFATENFSSADHHFNFSPFRFSYVKWMLKQLNFFEVEAVRLFQEVATLWESTKSVQIGTRRKFERNSQSFLFLFRLND